jgi:hypothetical protein
MVMTNNYSLIQSQQQQQQTVDKEILCTGYHQTFESPLGPLTKQPDIGRWISLKETPSVVHNFFSPLAGLPFDGDYILKFPKGSEFVVLPNKAFNKGVIRLHCCRQAESLLNVEEYGVCWTVENSSNEILASIRYGPNYQFEVSVDGITYESLGIKWNPGLNNFFSITMDLDKRIWHTYFRNSYGDEIISDNSSINHSVRSEISHMRIINSGCNASYSVEIGIGKAVEANEYEIDYSKEQI